jgi:hypothetical protein
MSERLSLEDITSCGLSQEGWDWLDMQNARLNEEIFIFFFFFADNLMGRDLLQEQDPDKRAN